MYWENRQKYSETGLAIRTRKLNTGLDIKNPEKTGTQAFEPHLPFRLASRRFANTKQFYHSGNDPEKRIKFSPSMCPAPSRKKEESESINRVFKSENPGLAGKNRPCKKAPAVSGN
jgi:hypothetical protein